MEILYDSINNFCRLVDKYKFTKMKYYFKYGEQFNIAVSNPENNDIISNRDLYNGNCYSILYVRQKYLLYLLNCSYFCNNSIFNREAFERYVGVQLVNLMTIKSFKYMTDYNVGKVILFGLPCNINVFILDGPSLDLNLDIFRECKLDLVRYLNTTHIDPYLFPRTALLQIYISDNKHTQKILDDAHKIPNAVWIEIYIADD
jgi:hypothetical protein